MIAEAAVAAASAGSPPLIHRVLVFDSPNAFEGVQTHIATTADGRVQTVKQESILTGGTCEDLIRAFQRRPLGVMESNAYISPVLSAKLSDFQGQGHKPSQFILLIQESEVTEEQARRLIPNSRELEERTTMTANPGRLRRVLRGAMWAQRGFEVKPFEPSLKFNPLSLSWEKAKLPQGLARPFDRERVRHVYEIGRTLSEAKPFGGDFKRLAAIMTEVIANETDALGLDPRSVLITAHALGSAQGRLFVSIFPFHVLNQAAMEKMEEKASTSPPGPVLVDDIAGNTPSAEEWEKINDVVVYASLARFIEKFPMANLSSLAQHTAVASEGRISAQKAGYFWRDFKTLFRQDFYFDHPHLGRSKKPLIITRAGDGMFIQDLMALLESYGMPRVSLQDRLALDSAQKLIDLAKTFDVNYAPDLFLENWEGRDIILHPGLQVDGSRLPPRPISSFITNLDPEKVRAFPRVYLASVLLAVRDKLDFQMTQLSPARFIILRDKVNEDRAVMRLAPVATVDADIFFETYGLGVGDTNPLIQQELALLGGIKFKGMIMQFSGNALRSGPSPSGLNHIHLGLEQKEGDLFEFKTPQLKKLAQDYPYLARNARANLKSENLKSRLKMMFAPLF